MSVSINQPINSAQRVVLEPDEGEFEEFLRFVKKASALKPKTKVSKANHWNDKDIQTLIKAHEIKKLTFEEIAKKHFGGKRTALGCQNKYFKTKSVNKVSQAILKKPKVVSAKANAKIKSHKIATKILKNNKVKVTKKKSTKAIVAKKLKQNSESKPKKTAKLDKVIPKDLSATIKKGKNKRVNPDNQIDSPKSPKKRKIIVLEKEPDKSLDHQIIVNSNSEHLNLAVSINPIIPSIDLTVPASQLESQKQTQESAASTVSLPQTASTFKTITEQEESIILENLKTKKIEDIAKLINRSTNFIYVFLRSPKAKELMQKLPIAMI